MTLFHWNRFPSRLNNDQKIDIRLIKKRMGLKSGDTHNLYVKNKQITINKIEYATLWQKRNKINMLFWMVKQCAYKSLRDNRKGSKRMGN